MRLPILFMLLLSPLLATAAADEETWMSVLLDGRKIGSMHNERRIVGERVVTSQTMTIELDRAGTKIAMSTSEYNEETRDGRPLAFQTSTRASGLQSKLSGKLKADGTVDIISEVGGATQTRSIPWPKQALLAEGLRLAEMRAGLEPGNHFSNLAFQSESLDAVQIDSTVVAREAVELPQGRRELTKVSQLINLPGAPTRSIMWVDKNQSVAKMMMPLMGYDLTMLACSRACAQAANQSSDILVHALVQAPRALNVDELAHGMRLKFSAKNGDEPLQFASTDEQSVSSSAQSTTLDIAPVLNTNTDTREEKPGVEDLRANDWLQSAAPEIVSLAGRGIGDAGTPNEQMQNLQEFVRHFIRNKNLNVGYASALEVAKNPEGDCTEHAVLLAALGRARGIPTRVVNGLAYVDSYAGGSHVFVPHAWAQAYVDGHWKSFDAALPGFDAGHIALSTGDGDPWRFFAGFNTLGRLHLDSIEPLATLAH